MLKKIAVVLAFLGLLALGAATHTAGSIQAGGVCSPGQHGNPHPGFKPGSCDNK